MGQTSGSTSSTDASKPDPAAPTWVSLGRVVGAHGMRGQLRVRVYGGDPTNLVRVPALVFGPEGGEARPSQFAQEFAVVEGAEGRPGEIRLTLAGIDDRDAAEALQGRELWGRAEHLEALPPGEYYAYQLVGCRVEDQRGQAVGVVREIAETGAADVLVVEDAAGARHLVPAREPLLVSVDLEARCIRIDAIPGLLDGHDEGAEGDES